MSAAIDVKDLCNRFGEQVVHQGLNLHVQEREILSIVGGSGTGKSVLLRCIIGLMSPTSGTIEVLGHRIGPGEPPPYDRMGVVFQQGALWSQLTVRENVMFPMQQRSTAARRCAGDLAELKLSMVGLDASAFGKYPAELSGGMRKRVGIARALALDPRLLFLDEPTAGLDPIAAAEFDGLVEYLHRNLNLTVVMVTHDLDSLARLSNRVAAIVDGKIISGSLDELVRSDHPWLRSYFHGERARAALGNPL